MKKISFSIITLLMLFYSNKTGAQSPNTDALFSTVFVDEFDSIRTRNWNVLYPWGSFTNSNTTTTLITNGPGPICVGSPNFPCAIAGNNNNINDTNNFKLRNNSGQTYIRLTTQKETPYKPIKIWKKWYGCSGSGCGTADTHCNNPCWGCNCVRDSTEYFKFSSGMLASKRVIKYGYIEIKFRLPELNNPTFTTNNYLTSGPTFWLYGNTSVQPYSELDIYEISANDCRFTNNWHVSTAISNAHNDNPFPNYSQPNYHVNVGQWHTAGVNWTPTYLDYYLDDNLVRRSDRDSVAFLDSMYLYIDNFVPNAIGCFGIDSVNTPFPIHYDIDYVKIWNPALACSTDQVYTNVTQSSYVPKIYRSLTIGGTGYSATFTSGFTHFAANNGIELDEGFEVSSSGTALLEALPCFTGMTSAAKPPTNQPSPVGMHKPD